MFSLRRSEAVQTASAAYDAKVSERLKAVGATRVSTDDQALSVEAQRQVIESWCTKYDVELVAVYDDIGVSGAAQLPDRKGLNAALADIKAKKAQILIVAKWDRLSRDVYVAELVRRSVERVKGHIFSADGVGNDETPEGKLLRGMLQQFAAYEREAIRARVKAALRVKIARGEALGETPYGYKREGKRLAQDPHEQRIIQMVTGWWQSGMSLRKIVGTLERNRYKPRGKKWHMNTIRRILTRYAAGKI